jgi:NADH-quinone oxidoreductase subunit F
MEFIPHLLIEGMITAVLPWVQTYPISTFVENTCGFIKSRKSHCRSKSCWLVRKNILGTGYDLELYVHIGAGAYICVKKQHL